MTIGVEDGEWQKGTHLYLRDDPFNGADYGDTLLVALPEGWGVDTIASGDEVIHCPDHRP